MQFRLAVLKWASSVGNSYKLFLLSGITQICVRRGHAATSSGPDKLPMASGRTVNILRSRELARCKTCDGFPCKGGTKGSWSSMRCIGSLRSNLGLKKLARFSTSCWLARRIDLLQRAEADSTPFATHDSLPGFPQSAFPLRGPGERHWMEIVLSLNFTADLFKKWGNPRIVEFLIAPDLWTSLGPGWMLPT
jgi:hypothetical protein